MHRIPLITKDGSATISIPEMNVTYHSVHGAIQESMHVFIEAGFRYMINRSPLNKVAIFETGFGTGLNALLTLMEAERTQQHIHYAAIELFPLQKEETSSLNYCEQLNRPDLQPLFEQLHNCEWGKDSMITPWFTLHKINASLPDYVTASTYNIIYFDAFAPTAQPELWTKEIFEKIAAMMLPGAALTTYCSKGDVRRAMQAAGLVVEKIPGPPGKREMVRALLNF